MAQAPASPEELGRQKSLPGEGAEGVSPALQALETYKKKDPSKVVVRFKAVGNAPIMKQNFYKITAANRFQAVIQFLRKELGWKAGDPLFTYINLAFSPAPDDTVSNLYKACSPLVVDVNAIDWLHTYTVFCDRWALDREL
ncbi:ubiquitin-like autophagy protein Apg12-domain-containing protein [Scleroderma yunnanense]